MTARQVVNIDALQARSAEFTTMRHLQHFQVGRNRLEAPGGGALYDSSGSGMDRRRDIFMAAWPVTDMIALAELHLPHSALTMAVAQWPNVLPLSAMVIASVLVRLDRRLEEAAQDLGATG